MKSLSRQRDRDVVLEGLERRLFMDGAVRASVIDGDLVISGDDEDNQVLISRLDGNMIRVGGLEGTSVGGKRSRWFYADFDDLEILMRQGGEDQVLVQGPLRIPGDLDAELADGELVIEGSSGLLEIGENLNVKGGTDCEVHVRNEVVVRGNTNILTGGGGANVVAAEATVPDFASASFSNPLAIDNPYFPLVPGTAYTYEEQSVDEETGETVTETIVVEVTNETKTILGVVNRVLRDRVFVEGLLVEDTFDWHAQDDHGNVWYFGEESTDFEYDDEGNLISTSTETSWQAGVNGAQPGIIMEARPAVGDRYYQEFEPGGALDIGEVLATNRTTTIPFGRFTGVLKTEDTSVLSPDGLEHKFYAPGLGLIQEVAYDLQSGDVDGTLRLVSATLNGNPIRSVVPPSKSGGANVDGRRTGAAAVFGETLIRTAGPVVLKGVHAADEVEIIAKADVAVVNSLLDDLTIQAADSVALWQVMADEEVEIRGDVDVAILGSTFHDDVGIVLGSGDTELVVKCSAFHELEADGGSGEDAFDDRGRNRFEELDLRRFEE